jgi:carbamoyl-phosphate synthase small subunit
MEVSPDGIMLSNGPGNPMDNANIIENIKVLFSSGIPMFGICLGHQLMALACGFKTDKLKYGHRGANQPVRDNKNGKVYITSQNHGYTVRSDSIDKSVALEWFVNVNDQTCEGIIYSHAPAFSVQFHPEACGGPWDTGFLFDLFLQIMEDHHAAG